MEISDSAQEILEALWIRIEEQGEEAVPLTDLGVAEGGTPLAELKALELVALADGYLMLTDRGRPMAADTVRRHRLAERLLVDVLATEEHLLEEHACRFEHLLFEGIDESICTLLGHPKTCPHDNAIPPGRCCRETRERVTRLVASLSELRPGQAGKIAYIQAHDSQKLQKLMAMGVLPGASIELIRRFPSYVFQVDYSQFAVEEEIAGDIYVRLRE